MCEVPLRARGLGAARERPEPWHGTCSVRCWGGVMADLAYVVATLVFFGVAWGYARACDRL
jgi:hypothetical protein